MNKQVYTVIKTPGGYQSIFPRKYAALSYLHPTRASAWAYIRQTKLLLRSQGRKK